LLVCAMYWISTLKHIIALAMFISRQNHVVIHTDPLLHAHLFKSIYAHMFKSICNIGQQFTQGEIKTHDRFWHYNAHVISIVKEDVSFQNVPPRPIEWWWCIFRVLLTNENKWVVGNSIHKVDEWTLLVLLLVTHLRT
jgi:hypothetical protein